MAEVIKVRTLIDGQWAIKEIPVLRTTSKERRKAVTKYGWMIQTVDVHDRVHRTPTMFLATPPENWLEAIQADTSVKRYRLYKSGRIFVQGRKEGQ